MGESNKLLGFHRKGTIFAIFFPMKSSLGMWLFQPDTFIVFVAPAHSSTCIVLSSCTPNDLQAAYLGLAWLQRFRNSREGVRS